MAIGRSSKTLKSECRNKLLFMVLFSDKHMRICWCRIRQKLICEFRNKHKSINEHMNRHTLSNEHGLSTVDL